MAVVAAVLDGCSTPPAGPLAAAGDGAVVKMRQGQAVWRRDSRSPEVAGELIWAASDGHGGLLQFSKAPFSIAQVQSDASRWRADFGVAGRSTGGKLPGPNGLGWLRLEQALLGNSPPPPWEFKDGSNGDFDLENSKTGESIKGFLAP
jgi:hypothetical protein